MHVIRRTDEIKQYIGNRKTAAALGAFDGLHIGHRAVVQKVVESGFLPVVFTFRDNPAERLAGYCRYLTTMEERLRIFESWGVEVVIMPDFADVAEKSPAWFLDLLHNELGVEVLACGADFCFGKKAVGNVALLRRACAEWGAQLCVAEAVRYQGEVISATRIRDAVEQGRMEDAAAMLGRPFGFQFEVVHGNHLGRTVGMPTINQNFPPQFILPRFGVYASAVHVQDQVYCGVTNVGVKPTVGSDHALSETWMPDFTGDVYGETLRLELLGFIRDERKFSGLEELRAEVERNAKTAKGIFEQYRKGL